MDSGGETGPSCGGVGGTFIQLGWVVDWGWGPSMGGGWDGAPQGLSKGERLGSGSVCGTGAEGVKVGVGSG